MALNVKAAILICMGYIGGLSWVVQQIGAARVELSPPRIVHRAVFAPDPAADESGSGGVARDRRAVWAQRLGRPNPLETQAEVNRTARTGLALVDDWAGDAHALPPLALPPLVYEEPAVAESPLAGGADLALAGGAADGASGPVELLFADQARGSVAEDVALAAASLKCYRVAKGDTLMSIARREWKSGDARLVQRLVDANPQLAKRKNRLIVGEELLIPGTEPIGGATGALAAAGAKPEAETQAGRWYTIHRNDSLQSIAKRCLNDDRRWREIMELNGLADPKKIQPGTRIKLPPTVRLASR